MTGLIYMRYALSGQKATVHWSSLLFTWNLWMSGSRLEFVCLLMETSEYVGFYLRCISWDHINVRPRQPLVIARL